MSKGRPAAGELTGKKFAAILVAGFTVVIAVNLTMASFAIGGFSGTVVDNSYVASQKFNGWLDQVEQQKELDWDAQLVRRSDSLIAIATNVPAGATVYADIRRPLGLPDSRRLAFAHKSDGNYVTQQPLPNGRWIIRLHIDANGQHWVREDHLE